MGPLCIDSSVKKPWMHQNAVQIWRRDCSRSQLRCVHLVLPGAQRAECCSHSSMDCDCDYDYEEHVLVPCCTYLVETCAVSAIEIAVRVPRIAHSQLGRAVALLCFEIRLGVLAHTGSVRTSIFRLAIHHDFPFAFASDTSH